MPTIYGLIDSDTMELRYVGQTTKPVADRFAQHKRGYGSARNIHLNRWIKVRNINLVLLERDPEDLNAAERRWIREMRERGARLLNLTEGGAGNTNGKGFAGKTHSVSARAKISAARAGHRATMETREKMRVAHLGKTKTGCSPSPETRVKISESLRGRTISDETRAKLSRAGKGNQNFLGRKHTDETRARMSAAHVQRWNQGR